MHFRIYVDEAGTHSAEWLVIGMLFVPNHGPLHAALCDVKERRAYFNESPKHSARYKETHLQQFRSPRDVAVGKDWIDLFIQHNCYYRCIVVDWSIWDGKYFGDAFEAEALKKRRAYKKWAEMLLHPELKEPFGGREIYHAKLYLDRLLIMYGYDILDYLRLRFTENYRGESPYIDSFHHTDSRHDANQCLQLCDLLTGCLYQALVPSTKAAKIETRNHLATALQPLGVKGLEPAFWRGFAPNSLTKHFPKLSAWFWRPTERGKEKKKGRR
ncbi:MAG TPA: hypothetical protein DDY78_03635 [Planctomycetales bacterium]|jgi:hypothetical protein|nr:hypothetical protein [Planctomycetales bacterium]